MGYSQMYYSLLVLILQVGIFFTSCQQNASTTGKQANVAVRDSLVFMAQSGLLESVESFNINTPRRWRMEYRILKLAKEGERVQPGDTVVYFDPQPLQEKLEDARSSLEKAQKKLTETLEQNRLDLSQKKDAIRRLKMQLVIDSTRLANARFESEVKQQEFAIELKKTRLQLERAYKELEAQRIINQMRERMDRIKIQQAQIELQRIRLMQKEMRLITEHAGIVIYPYYHSGGRRIKVKEGETMFPGQTVLRIANLNRMKVLLKINEVDHPLISVGMAARLIVDAYPDTVFSGKIVNISRIASRIKENGTVKAYDAEIFISSSANYRLKPGLNVRAEIVLDTLKNAFRLPEWCVTESDGRWWVNTSDGQRLAVKFLRLQDGWVYVQGDLQDSLRLKTREF